MICVTLCACAIAVFQQWTCLGMQRNTHITGNKFDPYIRQYIVFILWMAVTCIYRCLQFRSLANCYYPYLMRGRGGTDIGIKLLPVMWVLLCIPRHVHCSGHTAMTQAHSVMHIIIRACSLCFFYNPYMSLFNSRMFHLLVSTLFLLV